MKSQGLAEVRRTLWKAADELRANSKLTPASAAGVDPARLPVMLARGQLQRWSRGLYRIPQLPIGTYDDLAGAVMRVGHGAVVSHRSSLYLHGLTDAPPMTIEVTVPTSARLRRAGLDGRLSKPIGRCAGRATYPSRWAR